MNFSNLVGCALGGSLTSSACAAGIPAGSSPSGDNKAILYFMIFQTLKSARNPSPQHG
jgi:hypothetical protein